MVRTRRLALRLSMLAVLLVAMSIISAARAASPVDKINHIIVIYQENWSFDSLYGQFPGANGIANAGDALKQVDKEGQPLAALPQPLDTSKRPPAPDSRFPANMPVQPYDIGQNV